MGALREMFKENLNASEPSHQSKGLDGNIRCRDKSLREMFVVVYLTLTDPLRIQLWSQDRRNQTKSNREQFRRKKSRESRQKKPTRN